MATQIACIISSIRQNGNEFEPHFVQNMIAGESYSGSIDTLPDGTPIPNTKDFISGTDDLVTAAGLTLCYVIADSARIIIADGNVNYLVLWRMDIASPHASTQSPNDDMSSAELSALQTYLADRLGYTSTQISNWLVNKFNVADQSALVTWSTSRARTATVVKIMQALSYFAEAKAEIEQ